MIDETMKKYRKEHPDCGWCIYYEQNLVGFNFPYVDEKCILKNKNFIIDNKIRARLCKYYKAREDR